MNERIEYHALMARQYASELHPNNLDMENWAKVYHEKFAELIVKECGEIAYKAYWDNPETVRGIHIKEKIKKHFGVEE
jgi:hypothetical protein